jgi:hypothetical protein
MGVLRVAATTPEQLYRSAQTTHLAFRWFGHPNDHQKAAFIFFLFFLYGCQDLNHYLKNFI